MASADPVATWWRARPESLAGTDDWRCRIPARHLPGTGPLSLESHDPITDQRGDVAIWQLPGEADALEAMHKQKQAGIRVLIDADDCQLGGDTFDIFLYPFSASPRAIREWQSRHKAAVKLADALVVSTPSVARSYSFWNQNAYICPNSIDPDDWPAPVKPDDGIFRIGFAGTDYHLDDLELVKSALAWASEQDGVEVLLLGADPTGYTKAECESRNRLLSGRGKRGGEALSHYSKHEAARARRLASWQFEHRRIPILPLREYRRALAVLDVGLAPLADLRWNRSRSDSKAIDYALNLALPVCADAAAYEWWRDKPMPLARDADHFLELVQWCVANRDEVRELAGQARAYVLAERTIEGNVWRWREACGDTVTSRPPQGALAFVTSCPPA